MLWSEDKRLKICDFGLAREIRSKPPYTEYVGTRWYRAPEIIMRHPFYNSPVDIWSLGCIACELFMLKPIFQGTSDTDQLYKIMSVLGAPTQATWPDFMKLAPKRGVRALQTTGVDLHTLMPTASDDAIDFIKQCLQYNPANRPSASRLLQHPFMQGPKTVPNLESPPSPKIQKMPSAKTVPINAQYDMNAYQQPSLFKQIDQQNQQQQQQMQQYNSRYNQPQQQHPSTLYQPQPKTIPASFLGGEFNAPISPQKSPRYFQQTALYQNHPPLYQQAQTHQQQPQQNYKNQILTQNRKRYNELFHSPRAKPLFPMKPQFA